MAVVRWDPWRELAGLERQLDETFGRLGRGRSRSTETMWSPALDVHQEGDTFVIRAELAGIDPENVDVTVDDNVLTVSGSREEDQTIEEGQWIRRERWTGRFQRAVSLPPGTEASQITATANHGVIEIRVPSPRAAEPQRIPLQTGGSGTGKAQSIDVTSSSDSPVEETTEAPATKKRSTGRAKKSTARKST